MLQFVDYIHLIYNLQVIVHNVDNYQMSREFEHHQGEVRVDLREDIKHVNNYQPCYHARYHVMISCDVI